MHRLVRFYNQNRKDIWKVIGFVILIIFVLQTLNYVEKKKDSNDKENNIENNSTQSIEQPYNNIKIKSDESVLTGEKMSQEEIDSIKIINDFFEYCNEQKIQEAYDLLSDECKEEMYSSVQIFKEMYYNKVLDGQAKNISIENWNNNTYKVDIGDDYLSSGKYTKENNIQDYITIQDDKLNINKYIGRSKIEKNKSEENMDVLVLNKDEYTFEIKNNSNETIILDPLEDINTMYIKDDDGVKYSAYTHEISEGNLTIGESSKKQIKIKYYSKYISTKKIEEIVFSRVMLNNNYYKFR